MTDRRRTLTARRRGPPGGRTELGPKVADPLLGNDDAARCVVKVGGRLPVDAGAVSGEQEDQPDRDGDAEDAETNRARSRRGGCGGRGSTAHARSAGRLAINLLDDSGKRRSVGQEAGFTCTLTTPSVAASLRSIVDAAAPPQRSRRRRPEVSDFHAASVALPAEAPMSET
jgi:hypothetical protein